VLPDTPHESVYQPFPQKNGSTLPAGYSATESMLVLNDLSDGYRPNLSVFLLDGDTPTSGAGEGCQLDTINLSQDVAVTTDRVLERNLTLVTLVVKINHSGLS